MVDQAGCTKSPVHRLIHFLWFVPNARPERPGQSSLGQVSCQRWRRTSPRVSNQKEPQPCQGGIETSVVRHGSFLFLIVPGVRRPVSCRMGYSGPLSACPFWAWCGMARSCPPFCPGYLAELAAECALLLRVGCRSAEGPAVVDAVRLLGRVSMTRRGVAQTTRNIIFGSFQSCRSGFWPAAPARPGQSTSEGIPCASSQRRG